MVKCVKTVEEALDSRYGPQESFKSRLGKYLGDLMELGDNISVTLTHYNTSHSHIITLLTGSHVGEVDGVALAVVAETMHMAQHVSEMSITTEYRDL